MVRPYLFAFVLAVCWGSALVGEVDRGAGPHGAIVLRHVSCIHPASGLASAPTDVLIHNERIVEIRDSIVPPPDAVVIDCSGKYAIPGLFDCHTHLVHRTGHGEDTLRSALSRFVANGVLYVRDVGGPLDVLSTLSHRVDSGDLPGPEIFFTGPMLEQSPLTWAEVNAEYPGFTVAIDSPPAVDSILSDIASHGGCCVKTFNTIEPALYRYVKKVADSLGLRVVHDPGTPLFHWVPVDSALAFGVTSIEHAKAPWPSILSDSLRPQHDSLVASRAGREERFACESRIAPMGVASVSLVRLRQLADLMIAHEAYLCPTLSVFSDIDATARDIARSEYQGEGEPPDMMVGMIKTMIAKIDSVGRLCVREFAAKGVKMLVGQDGDDPDASIGEMVLMSECGVSAAEILRGATTYPARWLGIEKRVGSIAVGSDATLIVLGHNPLEDIRNLRAIDMVIQRGTLVRSAVPTH